MLILVNNNTELNKPLMGYLRRREKHLLHAPSVMSSPALMCAVLSRLTNAFAKLRIYIQQQLHIMYWVHDHYMYVTFNIRKRHRLNSTRVHASEQHEADTYTALMQVKCTTRTCEMLPSLSSTTETDEHELGALARHRSGLEATQV